MWERIISSKPFIFRNFCRRFHFYKMFIGFSMNLCLYSKSVWNLWSLIIKRGYSRAYSKNKRGYTGSGGEVSRIEGRRKCEYDIYIYIYIYVCMYIYIYDLPLTPIHLHHWRMLWSNYRKLGWVGFDPTTTEFRSDALTDWAIRLWVQLEFHGFFSVIFRYAYICIYII